MFSFSFLLLEVIFSFNQTVFANTFADVIRWSSEETANLIFVDIIRSWVSMCYLVRHYDLSGPIILHGLQAGSNIKGAT